MRNSISCPLDELKEEKEPLDELTEEKEQHRRLYEAYRELVTKHAKLQNKYIDLWLEKKYAEASAQTYKEMAAQAQTNPYAIATRGL